MARTREPKHKVSRRFGMDIYGTGGAALERRLGTQPGGIPRGRRRRRPTEYALQLHEKQKAKAIYGVTEAQFRRCFEQAAHQHGVAGHNLLRLLERRLDNVVYRLGFARSRPMARQMVNHGHLRVNGRRVDIPSYLVDRGDVIALSEAAAGMPTVVEELQSRRAAPRWLERDGTTGRVVDLPSREDVEMPIDEEKIVAFYAR
jgi:small subunit ribosomal protein S4